MEGGAIHVDGEGTLITTESCLLNSNRNPLLSRSQIEGYLKSYLNVEKIIWLPQGVHLDETDGHVDNLCCFIRPGVVALTWTNDIDDPQRKISEEALDRLLREKDARGRSLAVHKIHQPGPLFMTDTESKSLQSSKNARPRKSGDRLAGSYINFYMANGGVVMPLFDDFHDEAALQQLQALLPDRTVVGVPSREILLGGGNIHCITQQVPVHLSGQIEGKRK